MNSIQSTLKIWVRSRVIEIMWLSDHFSCDYVASDNMIADIGTRKGAKIKDVGPDSVWTMGFPWMGLSESEFPIKNISEVSLSIEDNSEVNNCGNGRCLATKYVPNQVGELLLEY